MRVVGQCSCSLQMNHDLWEGCWKNCTLPHSFIRLGLPFFIVHISLTQPDSYSPDPIASSSTGLSKLWKCSVYALKLIWLEMCGKKYKLEGGQNTPSFSHYSHSNKTPVGSFPRDLTLCWLVLHTEHCWGNQRFTTHWKGIKEGCHKAGKKAITWQKRLYRRRNSRDGVVQIIPDQVLYTGVKRLCNLALDFNIRGGYPCLVAVSRLRNVWPQGFQDSGHSL